MRRKLRQIETVFLKLWNLGNKQKEAAEKIIELSNQLTQEDWDSLPDEAEEGELMGKDILNRTWLRKRLNNLPLSLP